MYRCLLISFISIISTACSAETSLISGNTGKVEIKGEISSFDSEKYTLSYCGDYLCLIDGKPFFGSDGKIPKTYLTKLEISVRDVTVPLDTTGMFNSALSNSQLVDRIKVQSIWGDNFKIRGNFSDGAASYVAEWLVIKDSSIRTYIGSAEDLVDLTDAIGQ